MPDPAGVPDPAHKRVEGRSDLLASISREMVSTMKEFYGKGPIKAKSYLMDDLLLVVLRGGSTVAEQTMLDAGQGDAVRDFRQRFESEMAARLVGTIEQLTGRKVITHQSQIMFDPDVVTHFFIFDDQLPLEVVKQTVEALIHPDAAVVTDADL